MKQTRCKIAENWNKNSSANVLFYGPSKTRFQSSELHTNGCCIVKTLWRSQYTLWGTPVGRMTKYRYIQVLLLSMSIVLGVVRHGINEEYAWLPEVSELIRRFSRPLPKCLACNDFHNSLPLRTREILEEALQSPVLPLFMSGFASQPEK